MHRRRSIGLTLLLRLAVHTEGLLCGPVPHQGSLHTKSHRQHFSLHCGSDPLTRQPTWHVGQLSAIICHPDSKSWPSLELVSIRILGATGSSSSLSPRCRSLASGMA